MLVLWVVALLTIIAIGMTATQRTESTLAANQLGSAHFRAQADAAINYAAFRLMAQPSLDGEDSDELWIPDGTPRGWMFAGLTDALRSMRAPALSGYFSPDAFLERWREALTACLPERLRRALAPRDHRPVLVLRNSKATLYQGNGEERQVLGDILSAISALGNMMKISRKNDSLKWSRKWGPLQHRRDP